MCVCVYLIIPTFAATKFYIMDKANTCEAYINMLRPHSSYNMKSFKSCTMCEMYVLKYMLSVAWLIIPSACAISEGYTWTPNTQFLTHKPPCTLLPFT